MASSWEGLSIAPGDTMFTVAPTWERIDNIAGVRVSRIDIRVGRQDAFERTDTGTMTVTLTDRTGTFDPANGTADELESRPIALALRDPVTDEWFPRFRGVIDEVKCELDGSQRLIRTTITAVDALDYFAGFELAPGLAGDSTPSGTEGDVVYRETPDGLTIQDRFQAAFSDAGWPTGLYSAFTGNVRARETPYSPGEKMLSVLHDAADAEFPTVANLYVDKYGIVCFHGRYARFDPDGVSATATHWDFNRWKAGDGTAISTDPTRAQMRPPFVYSRSRKMVRNAALCYPKAITDLDIPGQLVTDPASIAAHGLRSWSATDLVVLEGTTSGNNAAQECVLYAQYIIDNYALPVVRIDGMTILSVRPDDDRGPATWALLTQIDISDIVDIEIGHPGGGGFGAEFYVEGLSITVRPLVKDLDTGYPMVTLSADLSPAAYWAVNPFGALP